MSVIAVFASPAQQRERQARDIGEALFLTLNTVARRLRRISRKLDIDSRAALKAELETKTAVRGRRNTVGPARHA